LTTFVLQWIRDMAKKPIGGSSRMDSNVGCEDLRALDVELRPTTPFSKGLAVCFRIMTRCLLIMLYG